MEEKVKEFLNERKIDSREVILEKRNSLYVAKVYPRTNTPISKIEKISRDLALHVRAFGPSIITPKYSDGFVEISWLSEKIKAIEIPSDFPPEMTLPIPLGVGGDGDNKFIDLAAAPHILVGGTTGSGKSWFLHSVIQGLLSQHVEIYCFDPKQGEFLRYFDKEKLAGFKNYKFNHFSDIASMTKVAQDLVFQMEDTYRKMASRSLSDFKQFTESNPKSGWFRKVLIIDEFTDLIGRAPPEFMNSIQQLAQKSRAAGIHIIAAAQNPTARVFTSDIKANFPVRISFRVAANVNSRVILDRSGAESLSGAGDGIALNETGDLIRFQGFIPKKIEMKQSRFSQIIKGLTG